jgi:predicted O-linked N-acetylglucosamine transferase (SPINDLY family)
VTRPRTWIDRAAAWLAGNRPEQAEPLLRRALAADARDPAANRLLAVTLLRTGRAAQAEFFARRAVDADPSAESFSVLGGVLLGLRRPDDAAEAFAAARRLAPGIPALVTNHAQALATGLRVTDALRVLRDAAAAFPHDPMIAEQAAYLLAYTEHDRAESLALHRRLASLHEARHAPDPRPFTNPRDPERTLRVGLVTPDLWDHPVSRFAAPLIAARRPGIQVIVFSTRREPDWRTAELREAAQHWVDAAALDDDALADRIRAQGVDVAVDLSGYTTGHRLGVFVRRAAPVQVTYAGYPNTTGLAAMGWRLVDSHTDPPGAEAWCTERLLRLDPCFLCFDPPRAPAVAPPPSAAIGHVTFGSFNNPLKVSDTTARLWAGVLAAVPESRLLLKGPGLDVPHARTRLLTRLTTAGIDPARIEMLAPVRNGPDHLALYGRVDVALDTFPYHGTTTTCEALWMGVPVVTLAGDRHASRVGVSLLHAAGVPEWIADSPGRYVEIAAGLAHDPAGLAARRTGQRERVAASVLCDQAAFAARFEDTVRTAWRARGEG